jgi:hypothetical protein
LICAVIYIYYYNEFVLQEIMKVVLVEDLYNMAIAKTFQ